MRLSSDQAWVACGCLLGLIVAGLPGGAGAQNSPPATALQGAASPGNYRLGVWIEPVSQWNGTRWVPHGLRIVGVSPGSPAERAGIQTGNVLTSVNGAPVTSLQDLLRTLENSGARRLLVCTTAGEHIAAGPVIRVGCPVARSIPRTPAPYYAPSSGSSGSTPGPRRVIQRPFYGNYGDAPSPNPFSTPPSYGNIVVP